MQGRLVSQDPGISVERVVLRAGELRAVTGPDGTFAFPALAPGRHLIEIETLPARVVAIPDKIVVEVAPGKTSEVEVTLQSAAGIGVRFVRDEAGGYPSGRRLPLERIRVALYGVRHEGSTGAEQFGAEPLVAEARTRPDGTLQFADLAPGTYRLVLDLASLPSQVTAAAQEMVVTIGEREWRTIEWSLRELPPMIAFDPVKPSAAFTFAPEKPRAGEAIAFRERATVDIQRRVVSWSWDFGDGHTGDGPEVVHVYGRPGRYLVTLTVTDSAGDADTVSQVVVVE